MLHDYKSPFVTSADCNKNSKVYQCSMFSRRNHWDLKNLRSYEYELGKAYNGICPKIH